jgi:hypothetical protein
MHVTVTYNVKSYDFFFKPIFLEFPHLKQSLLDDFSAYKATNQLPHYLEEILIMQGQQIFRVLALCISI